MKKLISLALVALSVSAFAASAHAEDGTLAKVKETGTITMGVRESSIPMSYLNNKQEFVGFHIDICNKIIEAVRKQTGVATLKVNQQAVTSANRIPLLLNGTVDIECGSTTNTVERQKQVAFALTTFVTNVSVITKATSGVKSLADLNGKSVAATTGTTTVQLMKAHEKATGADIKEVFGKDHAESFLLLQTDRAVAFGLDDYLLAGFRAKTATPEQFVFLPEVLRTEPIAIMVRKDDPAFKKIADDTIRGLFKSGEYEKIYAKWFMSPIPDVAHPLGMAMSPALKALVANPNDTGI
jgi:glutamate/aspartate transport system substrate-binding protein